MQAVRDRLSKVSTDKEYTEMEIFKNDGYELAELIDVIAGSLKKTIARLDDLSIYFDASFSWANNGL